MQIRIEDQTKLETKSQFQFKHFCVSTYKVTRDRKTTLNPAEETPNALLFADLPHIIKAVYDFDPGILLALLQGGHNPHICDNNGLNALFHAVFIGNLAAVKILVQNGVTPNVAECTSGNTPLHVAVDRGHYEIVNELVNYLIKSESRVLIDAVNRGIQTPLSIAVNKRFYMIIECLLQANADPYPVDVPNPLFIALHSDDLELLQVLIAGNVHPDLRASEEDSSLLMNACLRSKVPVVKACLAAKADVNLTDGYRGTALDFAVTAGCAEIVGLLLEHKAETNTIDEDGKSPLDLAAIVNNEEIMKMLIEAGANPNKRSPESKTTPLFIAAEHGHESIVELLIPVTIDLVAQQTNKKAEWLNKIQYKSFYAQARFQEHMARFEGNQVSMTAAEVAEFSGHDKIAKLIRATQFERMTMMSNALRKIHGIFASNESHAVKGIPAYVNCLKK